MASAAFHLTTHWDAPAPPSVVWDVLTAPETWPTWWRAVKRVEVLAAGDADGVGAYRRFTWATALPYSISFNMRTVRAEKPRRIEGRADGELAGTGIRTLTPAGERTDVRYDWIVEVEKPWMRLIAPLARPVFAWNHNVVMGWGREDLLRLLARR
jgi:uncharacterized protein YndB with AHSA1/START domain